VTDARYLQCQRDILYNHEQIFPRKPYLQVSPPLGGVPSGGSVSLLIDYPSDFRLASGLPLLPSTALRFFVQAVSCVVLGRFRERLPSSSSIVRLCDTIAASSLGRFRERLPSSSSIARLCDTVAASSPCV
jgi:hypothetical protein